MRYLSLLLCFFASAAFAATNDPNNPTWWDKYQYIKNNGPLPAAGSTRSVTVGANVDVSNECGPQSETYITLNTANPRNLAGGSNEIFRLPMRGYSSSDGGKNWSGVDLPLPPPKGNGTDFGSDPTLAFDSHGALYYGYIVVFFGNGNGINATSMAVAKSTDGGKTYRSVTYFSEEGGTNHFNDKPMITADANPGSPFRDNVYVAWDAASGGSTSGGLRLGRSTDGGATFTVTRIDDSHGPGHVIAAEKCMWRGTITRRIRSRSIVPSTVARPGTRRAWWPARPFHSTLPFRPRVSAERWSIRRATRTAAAAPIVDV